MPQPEYPPESDKDIYMTTVTTAVDAWLSASTVPEVVFQGVKSNHVEIRKLVLDYYEMSWRLDHGETAKTKTGFEDPNLLVQWFKNGDHPEDQSERFAEGDLSEGRVVRYFRLPAVSDMDVCPLCQKRYHEHGWLEQNHDTGNPEGPNYPGMVCPGDWILKTVSRPGYERYVVKRVSDIQEGWRRHRYTASPTSEPDQGFTPSQGKISLKWKAFLYRISGGLLFR